MTSVVFTLTGLDGSAIPSTQFKIEAAAPDGVPDPENPVPAPVIFTTNGLGVATVTLTATGAPYYLTRVSGTTDDLIAFKFFVPESDVALNLNVLYVDLGRHLKVSTDRAIYTLIETKVSMLNALNIAKAYQENVLATIANIAVDVQEAATAALVLHSAEEDPHGDRAYADSIVPVPDPNTSSNSYSRRIKFGNHTDVFSAARDCMYKVNGGVLYAYTAGTFQNLINTTNIGDCLAIELDSVTAGDAMSVCLPALSSVSIQPQQRWVTGTELQFMASVAMGDNISVLSNSTYTIGLSDTARDMLRSPLGLFSPVVSGTGYMNTGCAAVFSISTASPNIQCTSGRDTQTQTTDSGVPFVSGKFVVLLVRVTTTGTVEFYIDGALVATHSGIGVIPNGAYLSEGLGMYNTATAPNTKVVFLDEFAFICVLPTARTGFIFE